MVCFVLFQYEISYSKLTSCKSIDLSQKRKLFEIIRCLIFLVFVFQFIRSSYYYHAYSLTARPWAKRGSWFTRGFFFRLVCEQPKLPLGQILSHTSCDVYSPKTVETLINLIFHGKKLKTQRLSKIIFFHQKFSSEHIHIYICLNRRRNDLFRIFFPSGSTETSDYKITPNPHVAKKSLQTPDFEAI